MFNWIESEKWWNLSQNHPTYDTGRYCTQETHSIEMRTGSRQTSYKNKIGILWTMQLSRNCSRYIRLWQMWQLAYLKFIRCKFESTYKGPVKPAAHVHSPDIWWQDPPLLQRHSSKQFIPYRSGAHISSQCSPI